MWQGLVAETVRFVSHIVAIPIVTRVRLDILLHTHTGNGSGRFIVSCPTLPHVQHALAH